MLSLIREKKKSVVGVLVAGIVAFMMVGFGMNSRGAYKESQYQNAVIRVDKHEITLNAYENELSRLTDRLRVQMGENFGKFRQFLNLEQRTIDMMIEKYVVDRFLNELGLSASVPQVEAHIRDYPFFKKFGFTNENYQKFLADFQLTGIGLETQARQEIALDQLQNVLADLSVPSERELKAVFLEQNTKSEFAYLTFAAKDFESKVDTKDEVKLKEYFGKNAEHYKKPKSLRYSFVRFEPNQFLSKVEVSEEDLQATYTQKQTQFYEPKQVKLREIILKKGAGNSPLEKMVMQNAEDAKKDASAANEAKKAAAKSIVEKLKNGEDFQKLAKELSEDKESAANGGDMGWMLTNAIDKDIRPVVDRVEKGKYSDVLETADSFIIAFVEDIKPRRLKPFEEVKSELEADARAVDAPEYARVEAENFLNSWLETPDSRAQSLKDFASKKGMSTITTSTFLSAKEDAPEAVSGLTEKLISFAQGTHEVVRVGNIQFVVEVLETKDAYVPEFSDVKTAIEKDYISEKSQELAKAAAQDAIDSLRGAKTDNSPVEKKSLAQIASQVNIKIKETAPLTRNGESTEPFLMTPEGKQVVFGLSDQSSTATKVLTGAGEYYVVALKKKTPPEEKDFLEKLKDLRKSEANAARDRSLNFLVQSLRAGANVWVSPKLLENKVASEPIDL